MSAPLLSLVPGQYHPPLSVPPVCQTSTPWLMNTCWLTPGSHFFSLYLYHTHTHTLSLSTNLSVTHFLSLSTSLTHTHSLSISHTLSLSTSLSHTLSLPLSHTHTLSLFLSLKSLCWKYNKQKKSRRRRFSCVWSIPTSTFSTTCLPNEHTLVDTWMVMFSLLSYLATEKNMLGDFFKNQVRILVGQ